MVTGENVELPAQCRELQRGHIIFPTSPINLCSFTFTFSFSFDILVFANLLLALNIRPHPPAMASIINLSLRGLQVSFNPVAHSHPQSQSPYDPRTDRVPSPIVFLDTPHNGAGREHDRRCERWQSLHRQLCHVCFRLWNAIALLPHCRHNQRDLRNLAIFHDRSGRTQHPVLPRWWYRACGVSQGAQLQKPSKQQAQRTTERVSERKLTVDHRVTSRPTRSLEDQTTTQRDAKKPKR